MSRSELVKVKCPHCGETVDFKLWRSINTAHNPELKMAVRTGSAFDLKCDKCGEKSRMSFPCLYNQMEDGIMIYLVPAESVEEVKGMYKSQGLFNNNPYSDNAEGVGRLKMFRIVTSYNEFREKLMIYDDHRDDRAVELAKAAYAPQFENHNVSELLYTGRNQGSAEPAILAFRNGKPYAMCPVSDQLYAQMAAKVAEMGNNLAEEYVIDIEWAKKHL